MFAQRILGKIANQMFGKYRKNERITLAQGINKIKSTSNPIPLSKYNPPKPLNSLPIVGKLQ